MTIMPDQDDAPEFIAAVQALADGLLRAYAPPTLVVVKTDNWFGPRWLRFAGKGLGAVGVWKAHLTIPPFVPSRVASQRTFVPPLYDEAVRAKSIHIHTKSSNALKRYVEDVAPGAALFWYSGNSNKSGQGSAMAYVPTPDGYWPLYVLWASRGSWRIVEALETTAEDVYKLSRPEPLHLDDQPHDASHTA